MKCLNLHNDQGNANSGFTFIEIIISLAILSLLAAAVVPGIIFGFRMLQTSSESRLALANEAAMIQMVHASKEGVWFSDGTWVDKEIFVAIEDGTFPVYFVNSTGGTVNSQNVQGGMVRKDDLVLFLTRTNVSTVRFEPKMLIEAYSADPGLSTRSIQAIGMNTSFDDSSTQIEIVDNNNEAYKDFSYKIDSKTAIILCFPVGANRLRVDKSPYTVTIKTGNETVRNLLLVEPPYLVAVGDESTILLSADVYENRWWEELSQDKIPEAVRGNQLNAATYYPEMGYFAAVGENGSIIYSDNGQNWNAVDLPTSINDVDFYDILHYEPDSTDTEENELRFLAAGSDATIIYYPNASGGIGVASVPYSNTEDKSGRTIHSISRVDFTDSPYTKYKYMAVGEKGTLLYSEKGIEWEQPWSYFDWENLREKGNWKVWLHGDSLEQFEEGIFAEVGTGKVFKWLNGIEGSPSWFANDNANSYDNSSAPAMPSEQFVDNQYAVSFNPDDEVQYLQSESAPVTGSDNRTVYMVIKANDSADPLISWGEDKKGEKFTLRLENNMLGIELGEDRFFKSTLENQPGDTSTSTSTSIVGVRLDGDTVGDVTLFHNGRFEKSAVEHEKKINTADEVALIGDDHLTREPAFKYQGDIAEVIVVEHEDTEANKYFAYWGRRSFEKLLQEKYSLSDEEKLYTVLFAGDSEVDPAKEYKLKYLMAGEHGALIGYMEDDIYSHECINLKEIRSNSTNAIRGLAYYYDKNNDKDLVIATGDQGSIRRQAIKDLNTEDPKEIELKNKTNSTFTNDLFTATIYQRGISDLNNSGQMIAGSYCFVTAGSDGGIFYSTEILNKDKDTPNFEQAEINWQSAYISYPTIRAIAHRCYW